MEGFTRSLLNHFFPARCILCQQTSLNDSALCHYCAADLDYFDYQLFDNLMLQPNIQQGIKKPQFDALVSLAPYGWPFNRWIGDLKFKEHYNTAHLMAQQLGQLLRFLHHKNPQLIPDVILPMPIHRNRRFIRGYNQAQLIGNVLAHLLGIQLEDKSLIRTKSTSAQSTLNKKDRKSNVKHAFAYNGEPHQHVALIDDVITTGATVNEVCKVLHTSGIARISVWTVCATPLKGKNRNKREGVK